MASVNPDLQPFTDTEYEPSSLDALQSDEMRTLMNAVDKLRHVGLGTVLQLPQLVVCGDQSSGKSSVLEAITEIPFPRKENLCTRFATEIIMRRAIKESISTKIIPDKTRPAEEQRKLKEFRNSISGFAELPALMEEATNLMGLGATGDGGPRAFSRDVLSIEITGPGLSQLTLVDMPGLIHAENKSQSKEDVELIRNLVDDYIANQRTIILAVVSAKNDYANQIILKKAREFDAKGSRTLGIITKPDFLDADSENENSWIELAKNRDIYFELGWHILKNRSDKEVAKSFEDRNRSEAIFFSKGRYRYLDRDTLGIEALRVRLSQLLFGHLKRELPSLQREIQDRHKEAKQRLQLLGGARSTTKDMRRFLMSLSMEFQIIVNAAVEGHYAHGFFDSVDTTKALDHQQNMKRVRAIVQHLNLQFARQMELLGAKYKIEEENEPPESLREKREKLKKLDGPEEVGSALDDSYSNPEHKQIPMMKEKALSWVRNVLMRSRGRELPGNFNPMLISELFWEQSGGWESLAKAHIENVAHVCDRFVRHMLDSITAHDASARLQKFCVDDALKDRLSRAHDELNKIIEDKSRPPMTYNHYYTDTVKKMRNKKIASMLRGVVDGQKDDDGMVDGEKFILSLENDSLDPDMDRFSAQDALDCQIAYYKDELKYFIAAVTKRVVERYLIHNLAEDTISPMMLEDMTDDEVKLVASEPESTAMERRYLLNTLQSLEAGKNAFKNAIGLLY
ncbi:hypothetical protein K490DRAFT_70374 [Saccharata proteae CBS 121410]|uniref:Dynamin family protein n=1 Tax=Saccharata proteae CBS 121410 TaxID=1314787 RepID=A0A9P4I1Z8_9PEZI|nr:hypothetical protein K490DRAFT_70374 [Saccharata proteae CBS 121410]